jgi:hypothetical protein
MTDTITLDAPKTSTAAVTEFVPAYRFLEFVSVASHVGKSTLADFTAQLLGQFDIPIKFIRIESKAARSRQSGDVVHIDTENFAAAARLPGAEAAVLRPVFEILEAAALMKPAALRQRFGSESRYLVTAFQMHVAAFWKTTESEMLRVLAGADADPTS